MQTPFICRQCLSRLAGSLSQTPRGFRARVHTQAVQENTPLTTGRWLDLSNSGSNEFDFSTHASPTTELDSQVPNVGSAVTFRKHFGGNRSKARLRGSGPSAQLRSMILSIDGSLDYVQPAIMAVYGLPTPAGRQAVNQLKRLFWRRSRQEAGELLDEFHAWKVEYALIRREMSKDPSERTIPSDLFENAGWADFDSSETPSVEIMRTAWLQLDEVLRQKLWPRMMLAALDSSSAVFSAFVQATYDPSWSPIYVVEDIVRLIMLRVRLFGSAEQAAEKQELVDTAVFLLQLVPPKNLALEQDIIGRIVSLSTIDRATDLFNYLETHDYRFNSQTLLQFASRFAKSNEHKVIAAENLCYAARHRDFDINSPSAASVCTSLLTIEKGHPFPDGAAAPDELFKILLEAGFQPNLFTMTALMRNFCVRGHLKTAWTIFDLLLERGIEPDAHVYSILLKASKKELDISSIRLIMSTVHSKKLWSPIILNDFLDILYMHKERMAEPNSEGIFPFGRRQRKTNNAFRPMLQVYAKFFRLAPLQKFWPFPLEDRLSWMGAEPGQKFATPITELAAALMPQPDHLLIEPDTITLTLMLAANIRSLDQPDAMLRTYNRFLNMLDARDPLALQLIERHGTLVYDIFLRGLLQFRKCLDPAVRLVKRMLQLSKDEHLEHGKIIRHPPPSVHTWTIMVNGFKNHKLPHGAVSMIRLMMTHGMQPNLHTWNALIAAFARAGNARGAVKAMRYLEASGLQPDQHTLDAFGHLRRRARQHAVALLEASRKEPVEPDKLLLQLSLSAKQDPEEKKLGFRKQPQFETDRPITKLPPLGEAQQLAEWDRETTQRDLSRRLQFNPRIRKLGLNDNLPLGEAGVYPKPPPRTHAARHLKLDREAAYSAEDIES